MCYKAIDIANFFITKGKNEDKYFTPMQLLRLVFISHGWNIAANEERLIQEDIEVWECGPIIKELYDTIKDYGKNTVTSEIISSNSKSVDIDMDMQELLNSVYNVYSQYTGSQLSNITNCDGSPWFNYYKKDDNTLPVIKFNDIKNYYKQLME